jgi:osmotically-inducible protein OsmY
MGILLRILLLAALVVGVVWFLKEGSPERGMRDIRADVDAAAKNAREAVANLDVGEVADELKRTGRVVRRKMTKAARTVAEATEDGRTSAAIKAKLALDPDLSALEISVDTTDGVVTLAGRVSSPENVAKAIRLALEEDNVREVISTLQVRPSPAAG